MMFINSFGLKGSAVLSSKDGNLSRHSHQKSGRNFSSFIVLIILCVSCISLVSCQQDDDLLIEVENTNQLNKSTQISDLTTSSTTSVPYGWIDDGLNIGGGIRRYYEPSKKWYILKVYIPEIRIKPVYRIYPNATSGTINPTFFKKSIASWISDSQGSGADALINASFFNLDAGSGSPYDVYGPIAEVAHPFGYDNNMISWGYHTYHPGQKRLRINDGIAFIETPNFSTYYETIATGYDPNTVQIKYNVSQGRTMAGVNSGRRDLVYFFVTGKGGGATQAEALTTLQDFGCDEYVMFDGSGSSQMAMNGTIFVVSDDPPYVPNRRVPCMLRMDNRPTTNQ